MKRGDTVVPLHVVGPRRGPVNNREKKQLEQFIKAKLKALAEDRAVRLLLRTMNHPRLWPVFRIPVVGRALAARRSKLTFRCIARLRELESLLRD